MISKSLFTIARPLVNAGGRQALKYSNCAMNLAQAAPSMDSYLVYQPKRGLFSKKKAEEKKPEEEQHDSSDNEAQTKKTESKETESQNSNETPAQRVATLLLNKPEGYEKQLRELFDKTYKEVQLKSSTIDDLVQKLKQEENVNTEWHKKIEVLRRNVKELEEDTELTRKRYEKQSEDAKVFAISKFAKDLLEVPDNLERAFENVKDPKDKETPLYEGVVATYKILLKILERHGVKQIIPLKEKFDPNVHEALFDYDDPTAEPGTCGVVASNGYLIQDRVLRSPKVGVVKKRAQ